MNDKKSIFNQVYKLGFEYEKNMHGCAQSTILAVENFFEIDDIVFKIGNSLSGGIAEGSRGSCGAFLAGSIIFSYFFGRDINSTHISGSKFKDKKLVNILRQKFHKNYNGETCCEIQTNIFGKAFDMQTEEGKKAMKAAGGHKDKCTFVVGTASKWIMEMLINEGVHLK